MQIHFKDKMEQAELHSAQMVDVEVTNYLLFLNMGTEISRGNRAKIEATRKIHTTRLSPLSFFRVSFR